MTGSAEGWRARRYVAVDGGHGAAVLAALSRVTPRLQPAASPRHADVLIAVEPITRKLAPAVIETARALPRPRQALVVGESARLFSEADLVQLEHFLPRIRRVDGGASVRALVDAALAPGPPLEDVAHEAPTPEAVTVPLPPKPEREVATEPVVVTLGPVQALTAGPMRLLLVCDGEQVVSAEAETGYAARQVARAMTRASWSAAARLAAALDPLAPVAGRLAYVTAVERLQNHRVTTAAARARQAALALERANNALRWLERFAVVLAYDRLADRAATLAAELEAVAVWQEPAESWIVPRGGSGQPNGDASKCLFGLAEAARDLRHRLARDRPLKLRTAGVGTIEADVLRAVGVTGPVLRASVEGRGDSLSRLLVRVDMVASDIEIAAVALAGLPAASEPRPDWAVPQGSGAGEVEGPRGRLTIRITSDGGERPRAVEWVRPSANVLAVVPHIVAGQIVADAEVTVASLDLAMAEADG